MQTLAECFPRADFWKGANFIEPPATDGPTRLSYLAGQTAYIAGNSIMEATYDLPFPHHAAAGYTVEEIECAEAVFALNCAKREGR